MNTLIEKSDIGFNQIISNIKNEMASIASNYLRIGYYLNQLNKIELEQYGFKTIYEVGEKEFNLSKTAINNSINASNKYLNEKGELKESFDLYNFSALVELLPVPEEVIQEEFNPKMTVSEIREVKASIKKKKEVKHISIDDIIENDNVDENECIYCGCSEENACSGGCSCINDDKTICSNCSEKEVEVVQNKFIKLDFNELKNKIDPFLESFLRFILIEKSSPLFAKIISKNDIHIYLNNNDSNLNKAFITIYYDDKISLRCIDEQIDVKLNETLNQFYAQINIFKKVLAI